MKKTVPRFNAALEPITDAIPAALAESIGRTILTLGVIYLAAGAMLAG